MAFANDLRISIHTWPLLETEHWDATIEWPEDEEWPVCLDIFKDEVVLFFKEEEGWALVRRMDPKNIWRPPDTGWVPANWLAEVSVIPTIASTESQVQTDEVEEIDMPSLRADPGSPEFRGYSGA